MIARLKAFVLLLVSVWVVGCNSSTPSQQTPPPPAAPAEPKKQPPRTVEEVREAFIKAVDAKDYAAMVALADVPWLDTDRHLIRDRNDLPEAMKRVVAQMPRPSKLKVLTRPYETTAKGRKDFEAEYKLLDEVVGENGWHVYVDKERQWFQERSILIRVKDGQARVVGGPLKWNQIIPRNKIPEGVQKLLGKSDSFELYSLEPDSRIADPKKEAFHKYEVLGKIEVKSAENRKWLVDELRQGVDDNRGTAAGCFDPRHGIRMKAGADTVDLVICFECKSVSVYVNGKEEKEAGFLISGEPQDAFDTVLKAANVKLPKDDE